MEKEEEKRVGRYIFFGIVVILILLAYFIIKSYIIALISAFILAYLTKPLHDKLSKKLGKKISAAICILIVVLLIVLPFVLIINSVTKQANEALKQNDLAGLFKNISASPSIQKLGIDAEDIKTKGINLLIGISTSTLKYLPVMLISILIALWGMYYFLINWDYLVPDIKKFIPFKNKERIAEEIDSATRGIVHGMFFIAIIEFAVASLGFYILGVKLYILLAILMAFLVFIPGVGPIFVWLPTALFYILTANYFRGIGVIVVGAIVSIGVETFLAGKIMEKKAKINPLMHFIGVLGGVALFGIFGFVIGPLILIYAIKLLENGIKAHSQ